MRTHTAPRFIVLYERREKSPTPSNLPVCPLVVSPEVCFYTPVMVAIYASADFVPMAVDVWLGVVLVIALRPHTPKYIVGGWSHYTDTSEPVNGNGAQNMATAQSGCEPAIFRSLAHEITNCSNPLG
jgi:hypothetical protein